ncbi:MAG: hypothetical protein MJ240_02445 [Kiritimatiellae bacterium]|nr:hypothetical protein [Kiritimatiellia bacterium]
MLFTKRMLMTLGAAAGAMVAVADGVAAMPQSFEEAGADAAVTTLTGWDGYGTIVGTESTRVLSAGAPLPEAAHTKHLSVDGWVTAAFDTDGSTNDRELEMLVKVAKPDDALTDMTDEDAKFALAIDTDGKLKYWTGSAWTDLCDTVFAENAWIRVSIVYDSSTKKCKVAVDGKIAMNGPTPWFDVLKKQEMTTLSSMKVVGSTAIDDVTLAKTAVAEYQPSFVGPEGEIKQDGSQVTLAWLDANDLPATQDVKAAASDESGLTYEQKFILGNKATDGNKFELKSISMSKSGETVKVTIKAPTFGTPAAGFAAKIQTSVDGAVWTDGASVTSGADVVIDLPAGAAKVTKFRIVVKK